MKKNIASLAALTALAAALIVPSLGSADGMHTNETFKAKKGMSVTLKAKPDAMSGYNLRVRTKKFKWTPRKANTAPRHGSGHAHLYLDGDKITRLYGSWFYLGSYYLGDLEPGEHEVEVSLNANDHAAFVHGKKPVKDSVTITVP